MQFQFSKLRYQPKMDLKEDICFPKEKLQGITSLLDMSVVHAEVELLSRGELVHATFRIQTELTLECAYSLEPVPFPISMEEELDFAYGSEEENSDEQIFYVEKDMVDLDDYILGLIITEIPMKVVKKGAKLPKNGQGYEVISEDEYYQRKEEKVDPRFAKLDEFED